MARIRTLKPQFFMSETLGAVSFGARLLFVGLWTLADREGRLAWKAKEIRAQIFPHDDLELAPLVEELVREDHVRFYEAGDRIYLWIPRFTEHQRPHPKEPPSTLPAWPSSRDRGWLPWKKTASLEKPGSIPSSPVGREGKGTDQEGKDLVVPVPIPVLDSTAVDVIWPKVVDYLRSQGFNERTIREWFQPCEVVRRTEGLVEIRAPKTIIADYLVKHYRQSLNAAFETLAPGARWTVVVKPLAARPA